ncbi:3-ketoacyl-ACP reductase [Chthonobacter albigriseus]|uniref:3-ketoacyl-ACP reductase n=1 Tax=Chthonobacter albigriseus TaxID=1683161 RepID=UPI0015EE76CF|nr:3-ketoacyl-ACP reductase [Chthonobacter albigriseus]
MSRPVALVTGGRRGIGRAVAEQLAAAGFDIAIADLVADEAMAEAVAAVEKHGAYAHAEVLDVADVAGHAEALKGIERALGRIDCLVNNAGRGAVVRGDLLDLTPENFDAVMDVNLKGTLFLTQAVVRRMLETPSEHLRSIVTISSVSAEAASPERADYCISKAGLSMFVRTLALRLADTGIGVYEVRPGIIRTDMTAGVAEKYDRLIDGGLVPQRRWGEPADVARAVVMLARGDLAFSQGQIVDVGGGLSLPRL